MSDCNGVLYTKEAILEFLIPSDDPESITRKAEQEKSLGGAVKGLRDVVEVKFEADPEREGRWICPITSKPLGAGTKAVYLVPCGHAFSEAAVTEMPGEAGCLQCNEAYEKDDVVQILPMSEADLDRLARRITTLKEQALTHSLKKAPGSKKRKKNAGGDAENGEKVPKLVKVDAPGEKNGSSGIKNSSTASLTARVLEEQEEQNKKRKLQRNENLNSLFSSRDASKVPKSNNDFFTRGFTIPSKDKR